MTEPTRTSTGIAYLTYDATLNTDASMIVQQKLDLSGNTTAQTFCVDAFDLAAERDISGALLADSDITDYDTNNLVYLGSNDLNVQKTFLSANENSTKAQLIALNAYEMTLGKNNQIPLISNLGIIPSPISLATYNWEFSSNRSQVVDGKVYDKISNKPVTLVNSQVLSENGFSTNNKAAWIDLSSNITLNAPMSIQIKCISDVSFSALGNYIKLLNIGDRYGNDTVYRCEFVLHFVLEKIQASIRRWRLTGSADQSTRYSEILSADSRELDLIFVIDSDYKFKVYTDGVASSEETTDQEERECFQNYNDPLQFLGKSTYSSPHNFPGTFTYFRVWENKVLTADQVLQLYNQPYDD